MLKFSNSLAAKLGKYRVLLASQSPRRRELFAKTGIESFECVSSDFDERAALNESDFCDNPHDYVVELAKGKLMHLLKEKPSLADEYDLLFGFDTVVYHDRRIIGKPNNAEEVVQNLTSYGGKSHQVITGCCILFGNKCHPGESAKDSIIKCNGYFMFHFYEKTEVLFRKLPLDVLENYAQTSEPFDKAGGYGLQASASSFVESINGDYYNVLGLPVSRIAAEVASIFS